jgi:hypothetical protein
MLDVSADGIRLRLSEPVHPDEELTLALPGPPGRAPRYLGTVVWSACAADGSYLVGVRLHERLSEDDLARLSWT